MKKASGKFMCHRKKRVGAFGDWWALRLFLLLAQCCYLFCYGPNFFYPTAQFQHSQMWPNACESWAHLNLQNKPNYLKT